MLDVPALESLLGTDLEVFCEDVLDGNKQKKKTNLTISTHAGESVSKLSCIAVAYRNEGLE